MFTWFIEKNAPNFRELYFKEVQAHKKTYDSFLRVQEDNRRKDGLILEAKNKLLEMIRLYKSDQSKIVQGELDETRKHLQETSKDLHEEMDILKDFVYSTFNRRKP